MIAPELEDDELKHDGPFFICANCGQLLTKERYNKSEVCPNCEMSTLGDKFYAVKTLTALWWYCHTENWLIEEVGFEDIEDPKLRNIYEKILAGMIETAKTPKKEEKKRD